jgi:putative phosphoribosyl transferase
MAPLARTMGTPIASPLGMRRRVWIRGGSQPRYRDREDAGRVLAAELARYMGSDAVVLALPRGGVPVAHEVARAIRAPLDVLIVRKLGYPGHRELALGAIASGGVRVLNRAIAAGVSPREVDAIEAAERAELTRREQVYRGDRPPPPIAGRIVILVDDGLATGATMRAAVAAVRERAPARIVVAVPVASPDTIAELRREADEVICPLAPEPLHAIGLWYDDFIQVDDATVRAILARAWSARDTAASGAGPPGQRDVVVTAAGLELPGVLAVPDGAEGLVIFAHGSGSSRLSLRNRFVAASLNDAGLGTLLFDLLTASEERIDAATHHLRFDIPLLTERLVGAVDWARAQPALAGMPIGLFGASTGAAAALRAAAQRPDAVRAVVSRGGRPDLAAAALPAVRAPTLLIVGGDDAEVLELNRAAAARLVAQREVVVVPGATHLFDEPGTLAAAACRAAEWFRRFLVAGAIEPPSNGREVFHAS